MRERKERAAERLASKKNSEIEERALQQRLRLVESRAASNVEATPEGSNYGRMNPGSICPRKFIPSFDG